MKKFLENCFLFFLAIIIILVLFSPIFVLSYYSKSRINPVYERFADCVEKKSPGWYVVDYDITDSGLAVVVYKVPASKSGNIFYGVVNCDDEIQYENLTIINVNFYTLNTLDDRMQHTFGFIYSVFGIKEHGLDDIPEKLDSSSTYLDERLADNRLIAVPFNFGDFPYVVKNPVHLNQALDVYNQYYISKQK